MAVAEIITVGDEILIGQIVDTNSAWIAEEFSRIGISIGRIVSVSDRGAEIQQAVEDALTRADIVVMTGGLGPTKDDITKLTLARMFSMKLIRDIPTYDFIKQMLTERGVEFNLSNQSQAMVPDGCTVLKNRNGSAPGMLFERHGKLLFSLAGVPFEMKALITEQVIPQIRKRFNLRAVVHRTVITFGLAESVLSERIASWEDALPDYLHLAYLPNPRCIRLRLSAYDVDQTKIQKEIDHQFSELQQLISPYYLGNEPASVESSLAELLIKTNSTLSIAESCTGGAISARITAMEGASRYYIGGVTSYSNSIKIQVLGVTSASLEQYGAVSQSVAEQMAQGVLDLTGSDYAIATTGIAGSQGGTIEKPVGTVWMAIAWRDGVECRLMRFSTLRHENIERASTHALNMLRLHILNEDSSIQNTGML